MHYSRYSQNFVKKIAHSATLSEWVFNTRNIYYVDRIWCHTIITTNNKRIEKGYCLFISDNLFNDNISY